MQTGVCIADNCQPTTVNQLLSDQFDTAFFFLSTAIEFFHLFVVCHKESVKSALACTCRDSLTDDHVFFQAFEEVLFSRDRGRGEYLGSLLEGSC